MIACAKWSTASKCFSRATRSVGGPRGRSEDLAAESASIARLADLSFESAAFGHGRAISHEAAQRFREFAARG
jgi:hypothetical protein